MPTQKIEIAQAVQALTYTEYMGRTVNYAAEHSGISPRHINRMRKRARERGWTPNQPLMDRHVAADHEEGDSRKLSSGKHEQNSHGGSRNKRPLAEIEPNSSGTPTKKPHKLPKDYSVITKPQLAEDCASRGIAKAGTKSEPVASNEMMEFLLLRL